MGAVIVGLILTVVPMLLLVVLVTFFGVSNSGDDIVSLIIAVLVTFFNFRFPMGSLLSSFLCNTLGTISPVLVVVLVTVFDCGILLGARGVRVVGRRFSSVSASGDVRMLLLA